MAARRFRSAIACALTGHKWHWRDNDAPYRCERCGRYDDEPGIVRAANARAAFNRWSPITFKITRKETWVRLGLPYRRRLPQLSVTIDLHYGIERTGELPGVTLRATLWRLSAGARIGGLWQDEDGNGRSLFGAWGELETYGWRWIGCWLGHKPEPSQWNPTHVYCARCDEPLKVEPESIEAEAA